MGRSGRVRVVAAGLMAAGTFGVSAAVLVWGGAGDRMVKAPAWIKDEWVLTGSGEYLDLAKGRRVENARVTKTRSLTAVPALSSGRVAVWDSFAQTVDAETGTVLGVENWRLAFDRRTGRLANCCGAHVDKDTGVPQSGLGYLWPFTGVRVATYQVFDPVLKRSWGAGFTGEETIDGIRTYRFVERVPSTPVGELKGVSGAFLGLKKGAVYDVERAYEAEITVWVDPRTGIPVDRREQTTMTLRVQVKDAEPVVLSRLDVRLDADGREAALRRAEDQAAYVRRVQVVIPSVAVGAGFSLAVSGAAIAWRARRPKAREQAG
ncbi:DUF3068 family protein [Actinocorallia herbida]|uniref:DUF3068 family protein n=1 Tax=Actinocorallia herbida TaxID=58109 RepID=A0A3N1D7H9_9ACTN|nr:DUF3068 domain-containing protein [Actinocorallia herbida]ROO89482.1 DUF3068 family protein [Actinocorallia herbida]